MTHEVTKGRCDNTEKSPNREEQGEQLSWSEALQVKKRNFKKVERKEDARVTVAKKNGQPCTPLL